MDLYLLVNKWNYFVPYPMINADVSSWSVTCKLNIRSFIFSVSFSHHYVHIIGCRIPYSCIIK